MSAIELTRDNEPHDRLRRLQLRLAEPNWSTPCVGWSPMASILMM